MRAIKIPALSTAPLEEVDIEGDWRGLAAAIGGKYIERVVIGEPWNRNRFPFVLVVDEEGHYAHHAQVNERASLLYATPTHGTPIVGDALVLSEDMVDDGGIDFVSLYPHVTIEALTRYLTEYTQESAEALLL